MVDILDGCVCVACVCVCGRLLRTTRRLASHGVRVQSSVGQQQGASYKPADQRARTQCTVLSPARWSLTQPAYGALCGYQYPSAISALQHHLSRVSTRQGTDSTAQHAWRACVLTRCHHQARLTCLRTTWCGSGTRCTTLRCWMRAWRFLRAVVRAATRHHVAERCVVSQAVAVCTCAPLRGAVDLCAVARGGCCLHLCPVVWRLRPCPVAWRLLFAPVPDRTGRFGAAQGHCGGPPTEFAR